jgi:TP901 family phage tail tape measure protein
MSAAGIRAGSAYVEIFAKDGQFQQAMQRIEGRMKSMGTAFTSAAKPIMALGSAIVAPIMASAAAFSTQGDAIAKMAKRTGLSTEAVSGLSFAAQQSGTDVAALETSLRRMQRTVDDAGNGSKTAAEALGRIGLTAAMLAGMSPENQLGAIADGLNSISDPGEKASLAMQIFGRAGTGILPMLAEGSQGMKRLRDEAQSLGLVMDSETAAKAEVLNDAINRMSKASQAAFREIGAAVAPILSEIADWLAKVSAEAGQWIKDNQDTVVFALKSGAAILGLGAALYAVGTAFKVAAGTISGFRAAVAVLPMLLSPVGLAIAGVAAVAGILAYAFWSVDKNAKNAKSSMKGVGGDGAAAINRAQQDMDRIMAEGEARAERAAGNAGRSARPGTAAGQPAEVDFGPGGNLDVATMPRGEASGPGSVDVYGRPSGGPSRADVGRVTLGTFGDGMGLGIAPEIADLEKPTNETAANTGRMAAMMEEAQANGGSVLPGADAPAAAAVADGAQAAVQQASVMTDLAATMKTGFGELIAAVKQQTKAAENSFATLKSIDRGLASVGVVFS